MPVEASDALIAMTLQNTTLKKTKVVHRGKLMSLKQQLLEGYNTLVARDPKEYYRMSREQKL